ncbi:MAG TPA: hypothetical protein VGE20_04205 [Ramlibacter sp.]
MEAAGEEHEDHRGVTRPARPGGDWEWTPSSDRGSGTAFDKFQREERVKEVFRGTKSGRGDEAVDADSPSAD